MADREVPRKQRHTARRVWQRLVAEHGASLAEVTVSRYVARRRVELGLDRVEVAVPQTHPPGAEAEVDFGEFYATWGVSRIPGMSSGVGSGSGCCAEVFGEDCRGGAVAQGGMASFPVVEHFDVFSDGESGTGPGAESVAVVHLVLQRREE